jgi:hypothetical protein
MAKGKTDKDRQLQRDLQRAELTAGIIRQFIRWCGIVACAYLGKESIGLLAGRETIADIVLKVLSNVQVNVAVSWAVSAVAGSAWYVERRLRKKDIERLSARTKELELRLDPNRTSSSLTPQGDTQPGDK